MTKNKIEICEKLFSIAKEQYEEGTISRKEYLEILYLIRKKIKEIKDGFDNFDFILKTLQKPIIEINLKDTVNFVLAMN